MVSEAVKGFVILTLEFHKDDRYWVGVCRELGVAADGRSLEKLRAHLTDLVRLHLNGLEAIGERERVFQQRGIRFYVNELPNEIEATLPVSDDERLVEAIWLPIEIRQRVPAPA